ncbi:hypothetical protein ANAPC5_01292 [Anaplasma phagocytophilum]|nr:hypothetical protein ANAPC5_01292 [Anaplasma phagocytophilum]
MMLINCSPPRNRKLISVCCTLAEPRVSPPLGILESPRAHRAPQATASARRSHWVFHIAGLHNAGTTELDSDKHGFPLFAVYYCQ